MSRPLRTRLDERCADGEGINVTREEVIGLLDALKLIARQSCTTPGCNSRACSIAALARVALRNVERRFDWHGDAELGLAACLQENLEESAVHD